MKILISAHVVWWNASAYYAVTAAQALQRRGHDVTVLAHHSTPAYRQAKNRGLKVIGNVNLLSRNPVSFVENMISLSDKIGVQEFDVFNPHRPEDHLFLALMKKRLPKLPVLIRTISDVRYPKGNVINRLLHERWTDAIIYCAECCFRRYISRFALSHLPQRVIYSALDVKSFSAGDWRKGNRFFELDAPRIVIAARLSPNKGHLTLIEAAARVLREIGSASFIVVGKEEEVKIADLREQVRRLGMEEFFTFTGALDDPRPAIAAADIGVIASTDSEVISRAAQEFFAFGVPVVASRVNVLPEMVEDGVNGILFEPGDAAGLADGILKLAGSERLHQACSRCAYQRALEVHDFEVLGEQTEEFLVEVMRNRPAI